MANYANIWCKIKASKASLEKIYEAMKLEKGTHEKWMRKAFLKLDSTLEVSSETTYGENTWITSCKKSDDNIQMTLVCNEGFAESEFNHLHKTFGAEISYLLHYNDSFVKFVNYRSAKDRAASCFTALGNPSNSTGFQRSFQPLF